MMFPKPFKVGVFGCPHMVNTVMRHIIGQVAQRKTGKKAPHQFCKNCLENKKQNNGNQQAQCNRHDQAVFIIRVLVVYAMKQELHPKLEITIRKKVKNITMQDVFKQGPGKNA